MGSEFKRTRIWVDPGVQSRLLTRLGAYMLIYTITLLHIGFAVEAFDKIILSGEDTWVGTLYLDYLWGHKSLLIAMFLILPMLLYDLLKFSHRIVGPLFRCRKVMQDMAEGKQVEEFVPRKRDLMQELFQTFNTLIHVWNARLGDGTICPTGADAPRSPSALMQARSPAVPASQPNPVEHQLQ